MFDFYKVKRMLGFVQDEVDYEPAPAAVPPPLLIDYKYQAGAAGAGEKGTAHSCAEPSASEPDGGCLKRRRTEAPERPRETDDHRLAGRQKQIDYGKSTLGYANYLATISKYHQDPALSRPPLPLTHLVFIGGNASEGIPAPQTSRKYVANAVGTARLASGAVYCIASIPNREIVNYFCSLVKT